MRDGRTAFRQIYLNFLGAVNQDIKGLPYPEVTILAKESFNNEAALDARRSPDLTLMVNLASGQSPETGDWEYVMGADSTRRGTGDSGLGTLCRDCHLFAAAYDYNFINSAFYERNQ